MEFTVAPISSIKSISQRALCLYWQRLAADDPFPSMDRFNPVARLHDPKQLVVWKVENDAGGRTFRALFQGGNVGEVFNSQWAGKSMEEIIPPALKAFSIDGAGECAESGCAVYTVLSTSDAEGFPVDCERLLLPLGRNVIVEQIVASLQLISLKGNFERKTILTEFKRQSVVTFAARITREGSAAADSKRDPTSA